MRGTALLLVLSWSAPAMAQAAVESGIMAPHMSSPVHAAQLPLPAAAAPAKASAPARKPQGADKQLHDNVETLMAVAGLRDQLEKNRDQFAESGRKEFLQKHPEYDPAFADEMAKRVQQRLSVDDFLEVVARIYEKNYTNQDVLEMIRAKQTGAAVSPKLQAKMTATGVTVNSQIMGGFTEVGYKLGAQIGQELAKEHPEWLSRREEPFVTAKQKDGAKRTSAENGPATIVPAEAESSPNFTVVPAN